MVKTTLGKTAVAHLEWQRSADPANSLRSVGHSKHSTWRVGGGKLTAEMNLRTGGGEPNASANVAEAVLDVKGNQTLPRHFYRAPRTVIGSPELGVLTPREWGYPLPHMYCRLVFMACDNILYFFSCNPSGVKQIKQIQKPLYILSHIYLYHVFTDVCCSVTCWRQSETGWSVTLLRLL